MPAACLYLRSGYLLDASVRPQPQISDKLKHVRKERKSPGERRARRKQVVGSAGWRGCEEGARVTYRFQPLSGAPAFIQEVSRCWPPPLDLYANEDFSRPPAESDVSSSTRSSGHRYTSLAVLPVRCAFREGRSQCRYQESQRYRTLSAINRLTPCWPSGVSGEERR
ncbi:hypothetical protein KM043_002881 [Ampulex compressa]|nr:hypothetical protein KM043_002881 [Ampulex compressa]